MWGPCGKENVWGPCGVQLLYAQKPMNRPGWWEGKFALISEAGSWEGRPNISPKADSPPLHWQPVGKSFCRQKERAACRNSTVNPDSHLQIGHWWSDQSHLGGFKYSYSSVPGFVETSSQNRGNLCCGWCLVIVWLTSSPWCFGIYKTAPTVWLRILSIAPEKELKVLDCA